MQITRAILPSSMRCDWHQTAFSPLIPLSHDFASLNTGAVVSPKLTTPGFEPVAPSTVLGNSTGACWSFRGNVGTFGLVLDAANVMPSHVVIHHWLFNSTTSLSRAPRQVIVWGMVDGDQNMKAYSSARRAFTSHLARVPPFPISKGGVFVPLGDIDFDITAPSLRQTVPLYSEVRSWGIDFGVLVLDIRSNWGGDVTSLCSVHVYGQIVDR
jgi:Sad1 / UNC-like C-terminal